MQKPIIFVKKEWEINMRKTKNILKLEIFAIILGNIAISNLKYSAPIKITIARHNGSNYDYHFIIKELIEELILVSEKTLKNT